MLQSKATSEADGGNAQDERVKAHAANALSELARDDADIQNAVTACNGIDALVEVVNNSVRS